jgi:DNA-binding NarL/FixJ family response regulator
MISGMHIAGHTHEPNRLASLPVTLRPDLVILGIGGDLRLDSGLAKYVFGQQTGLVVMQRPRPEVGDLLLAHGAAGCLALPLAPGSLSAAMVAVLRGLVVVGRGCASASGGSERAESPRPAEARTLLTPSEARVMTLVAAGYRSVDIAAELNLSVGTVKNRLSTAYARLGARNRAEAAAAWSAAR